MANIRSTYCALRDLILSTFYIPVVISKLYLAFIKIEMKKLARYPLYALIALICLSSEVFSQVQNINKDSLEARNLDGQAWGIMYSYPDSATNLCTRALELIGEDGNRDERREFPNVTAKLFNTLGVIKWVQTDYVQALDYFEQSLEIREEEGDKLGMAASLNNIGNIYYPQAQYLRAMEYFWKSLKIREELDRSTDSNVVMKNRKGMADANLNIGNVYYAQDDYENALKYYFIAVDLQEEITKWPDPMYANQGKQALALSLNNIGGVYLDQSKFPLGLEYFLKALNLREALGNKKGVAQSYSNIGSMYSKMYADYKSVEQNEMDLPAASKWWATTNPMELLDTAMAYQQKALEISAELSDEYGMTFRLQGIAKIFYTKGKYKNAIEYYHRAVVLTDSIAALNINTDCHSGLANCYEKLGRHELALEHFKIYSMQKDSMFNEQKSKDLGKLEAKHEFETAETERARALEEKNQKENDKRQRRNNLQYSAILIFIVLLFAGVFALGRFSIPVRLAEGMIFFSFLLFFEFMLVMLDPYIDRVSGGAPAYKLMFNAILAGMIFPLHSLFEGKLKRRISR